ncbi:Uncharacterised protein [Candidatus Bilamarchaeum dharawalense]|uniref:Uncharacterized protein n=1 Tax=Candidatus Bilamarchaeum dharawalense TaxID=2885759 RepID=A0A5E4LRT6_9ARCH|nr:Uncharacterised protein [Candidatus Bilamarchaeum dharawalense]
MKFMKKIIIPGIATGILMLIFGMIFSMAFGALFPSVNAEYQSVLFRPWTDPLMMLFFAYPFVLGMILAWVWNHVKVLFKEKDFIRRGLRFGVTAWVVFTIPGMFVSYTTFPISLLMVLSWTLSGLVYTLCAGLVLAKLNN